MFKFRFVLKMEKSCSILVILFLYCEIQASVSARMHPQPLHLSENLRVKREDDKLHRDEFESTSNFWQIEAQKKLKEQLDRKLNKNIAKNVIFFIGDGMSISTVTAGRIYSGQKKGFSGEESILSFEEFPYVGLSKVSFYDFFAIVAGSTIDFYRLIVLTSKPQTALAPPQLICLELKQIMQRSA